MSVSRALRNARGVSGETREKVLKIAREMGYVPNIIASNLVSGKTCTIGVIVPDIAHNFFHQIIESIEVELSESDYRMLLSCSFEEPVKEMMLVRTMLERRVDGIIIAPASTVDSTKALDMIIGYHTPVVLIDRVVPGYDVSSVIVDDYTGARDMVAHLFNQGYRRIAHIGGTPNVWTADERYRGYIDALKKCRLKPVTDIILRMGFTIKHGETAMERLLALDNPPDAIFSANDPMALGAYKVLRKRGIRIPQEIGLAGFSDIFETELLAVPLSTVSQDAVAIGRHAARIMLSHIRNQDCHESGNPVKQVIKTNLVIRESSLKN